MDALVVVDIQNDFMPNGALPVPNSDTLVPIVNKLQDRFSIIVATQDWHPKNHASFAANHAGRNEFEKIDLNGLEQILWPVHCVQGTHGADFHPDLKTQKFSAIFRKGMDSAIDSYSGFYDNGKLRSTGMAGYLREIGATNLFFCGLAADICVYYTLLDALSEGFKANLVEDASQPLNMEDFGKIKAELLTKGAKIISSNKL